MDFIWSRLDKHKKKWRRIVKILTLIEHLIKNGSSRCIKEFKVDLFNIKAFKHYEFTEDGYDRGQAVRDIAQQIEELLGDDELIEKEREKAKTYRDKMGHMTGFGNKMDEHHHTVYEGFGSKPAKGKKKNRKASIDPRFEGIGPNDFVSHFEEH
eukprot:CAMPEP_0114591602 /NCGR_PEP_ID=MMETSP0125-20121206/13603_1 /TAXON_ID=485358 ORGANISM="Aristerostoma sp., Strain ATCC 50986" /NCGR_SAMPLE_ID=MMETSP0125 /ASSEMBLY_ACC=CAM_ASM_000245 /LENGTH=153 /DNA_ID=CAMNT_0001789759 /DNA_START=264 /DNA_END=725 /DNA_ORIENTATION=+